MILVRDGEGGLEALMVRRSSQLAFAGGAWVFPGGRVDPADVVPGRPDDVVGAARRAAVREAQEEAGLSVAPGGLVAFSHWTPPPITPKRFSTWFFIALAPGGATVQVDGSEIRAHAWLAPASAIARRDAGEIELIPPTWITLHRLAGYRSADQALEESARSTPEVFVTHLAQVPGGAVAMYEGDAGYADSEPGREGGRHRLWMLDTGWRYEKVPG